MVLTTLILLICRTTVFHCLGIAKDRTFQYSVLMETGGLALGEGPNRLSLWRAFTRDFVADLPLGRFDHSGAEGTSVIYCDWRNLDEIAALRNTGTLIKIV